MNVELIPILNDNYVFAGSLQTDQGAFLVDPGDADPCLRYLKQNNFQLKAILITHHHEDHIGGVTELKKAYPGATVYAPLKNKNQIPAADIFLQDQQIIEFGFGQFQVLELAGHTLGHIGFFEPTENYLFSGDVLFGLGCGRLFEGSPAVKFETLQKLKTLPPDTKVFCTHEYTETNVRFTEMLVEAHRMPKGFKPECFLAYKNEVITKRTGLKPTLPLILSREMECNSFLLASDLDEFTLLRELRNSFR